MGLDQAGQVVIRKKCSRQQLLAFTANLQVPLIGMESCSGPQWRLPGVESVWHARIESLVNYFREYCDSATHSLQTQMISSAELQL